MQPSSKSSAARSCLAPAAERVAGGRRPEHRARRRRRRHRHRPHRRRCHRCRRARRRRRRSRPAGPDSRRRYRRCRRRRCRPPLSMPPPAVPLAPETAPEVPLGASRVTAPTVDPACCVTVDPPPPPPLDVRRGPLRHRRSSSTAGVLTLGAWTVGVLTVGVDGAGRWASRPGSRTVGVVTVGVVTVVWGVTGVDGTVDGGAGHGRRRARSPAEWTALPGGRARSGRRATMTEVVASAVSAAIRFRRPMPIEGFVTSPGIV